MIPPEVLFARATRKKNIIDHLTQMDTDIMLLQEVMQSEYTALTQAFQKTHRLIRGKNIKWQDKQSASGNVILLRNTLFKVVASLPFEFGIGVQCTYQNAPLFVFNVHLDDLSHQTRMKQLAELRPIIEANPKIIVGGDFNESFLGLGLGLGLQILNKKPTYYIERKMCIDNILVKGLNLKHRAAFVPDAFKGDRVQQFLTYSSDHLPVLVN